MTEPAPLTGPGPWACIDPAAIAHNLAWLHRRLRHGTASPAAGAAPVRLWAVAKADAYGHGLEHALPALSGADGIAVAGLDEALRARKLGWRRPIMMLSAYGVEPDAMRDPGMGELHVVIDDEAQLRRLERMPAKLPHIHAWLRYAGRLRTQGFGDAGYADAFRRLLAVAGTGALGGAGHLHHYAMAEDPQALAMERQAFARATAGLPGPRSTGNSASLCGADPAPGRDHWLRCGLALYGASALPGLDGARLGLRPAMSLHARLHSIQPVAAGESVGYGDSFRAARDTRIGVVGIGYGHGLPRGFWNRGVLLAGERGRTVPLAGRVSMDSLTIDLGPEPEEKPGDIVTLWGHAPGAGALLPVETAALSCGTIAAEMLTGLTARVPLIAHRRAD